MIPAGGEDEARGYYQGLLGLTPIPRSEGVGARSGLWFACGDREVHLGVQPDPPDPEGRAHVAFAVGNLAGLRARIEGADFEVVDAAPVDGKRRFHTRDPFGNRLEFMEETAS
jgi:catechol 2,3-dioxygenase-like lactoylglutathione lyase family enzyme